MIGSVITLIIIAVLCVASTRGEAVAATLIAQNAVISSFGSATPISLPAGVSVSWITFVYKSGYINPGDSRCPAACAWGLYDGGRYPMVRIGAYRIAPSNPRSVMWTDCKGTPVRVLELAVDPPLPASNVSRILDLAFADSTYTDNGGPGTTVDVWASNVVPFNRTSSCGGGGSNVAARISLGTLCFDAKGAMFPHRLTRLIDVTGFWLTPVSGGITAMGCTGGTPLSGGCNGGDYSVAVVVMDKAASGGEGESIVAPGNATVIWSDGRQEHYKDSNGCSPPSSELFLQTTGPLDLSRQRLGVRFLPGNGTGQSCVRVDVLANNASVVSLPTASLTQALTLSRSRLPTVSGGTPTSTLSRFRRSPSETLSIARRTTTPSTVRTTSASLVRSRSQSGTRAVVPPGHLDVVFTETIIGQATVLTASAVSVIAVAPSVASRASRLSAVMQLSVCAPHPDTDMPTAVELPIRPPLPPSALASRQVGAAAWVNILALVSFPALVSLLVHVAVTLRWRPFASGELSPWAQNFCTAFLGAPLAYFGPTVAEAVSTWQTGQNVADGMCLSALAFTWLHFVVIFTCFQRSARDPAAAIHCGHRIVVCLSECTTSPNTWSTARTVVKYHYFIDFIAATIFALLCGMRTTSVSSCQLKAWCAFILATAYLGYLIVAKPIQNILSRGFAVVFALLQVVTGAALLGNMYTPARAAISVAEHSSTIAFATLVAQPVVSLVWEWIVRPRCFRRRGDSEEQSSETDLAANMPTGKVEEADAAAPLTGAERLLVNTTSSPHLESSGDARKRLLNPLLK